ncbi:uncharacterized protein BJX67DRAFT_281560 [Aspergillus lucknowensis]|uniref:PIN domain-containing protein n=1 Tax=Aspergillus lucknowensis TaxID=176173 RepID=A0ABR4M0R9_9EURO
MDSRHERRHCSIVVVLGMTLAKACAAHSVRIPFADTTWAAALSSHLWRVLTVDSGYLDELPE